MKIIDWKEEAQKQAIAAGELKIKIAIRLSDVTSRIYDLKKQAGDTEEVNMLICILNRISLYKEEKRWLESILNSKGDDE